MGQPRSILVLCRISNLPTVFSNVLAAWFLGGGEWNGKLVGAALASALAYCGGMILNDVFDVEWDQRHGKSRPIPRGEISRNAAARLGWTGLGLGCGGFLLLGANPLWATGLAAGIASYNGLHKRWAGSMWLMGACRFFLYITVASIPAISLGGPVWLWGTALACYTAGITLAAREEQTSGRVLWEAHACLLAPAGCALLSLPWNGPALAWPVLVLLAFGCWMLLAYRRLYAKPVQTGPFVGLLLAGMVLVDAMALSLSFPFAALFCVLLLPLNLLLQAFVPPT